MITPLPVSWPSMGEIPRTIHQVWVGSVRPDWVRGYWAEWDAFAERHGFEIARWTDEHLAKTYTGRIAERYNLSPVGIANFLRVEVLAFHGGVYADSDTVPLRPMEKWFGVRPPWVGQGDRWHEGRDNNSNAVFGFPEAHPFLTQVWEQGLADVQAGLTSVQRQCGSKTWQKVWLDGPRYDVEFPHGPFQVAHEAKVQKRLAEGGFDLDLLREMYPDAVTLHLFYRSWLPSSRHYRVWFGDT